MRLATRETGSGRALSCSCGIPSPDTVPGRLNSHNEYSPQAFCLPGITGAGQIPCPRGAKEVGQGHCRECDQREGGGHAGPPAAGGKTSWGAGSRRPTQLPTPRYRRRPCGAEPLSWPQREGPSRAGLRPTCPGRLRFPTQALAEKTSLLQGAFAGHIVVSAIPVPPPRPGLIRPGHNFLMRQLPAI